MRIEPLTPARVSLFAEMARAMHAESAFARVPLEMDRLTQFARAPGVFCGLAVADGGAVVGLIVGNPAEFVFSSARVAELQLLYVEPEHRGGRAAVLLLHAFEAWAKEQNLGQIHLSQRTGVATAETARFFRSMGYRLIGCNAAKGL